MSTVRRISRRRMLRQTISGAAAGAALACQLFVPRSVWGANDQIGVGIIGCGRRNAQLVIGKGGQGAPPAHARIVAAADVNLKRAAEWAKHYRCTAYQDYRALLERKEVDVVIYATPSTGTICPASMLARQERTFMASSRWATPSAKGGRWSRPSASTSACSRPASSSAPIPPPERQWN